MYDIDVRIDVRVGINQTILANPVDTNLLVVFLNLQSILDFLFGDRVLKGQQDIRRFVCTGSHCDFLCVPTASYRYT